MAMTVTARAPSPMAFTIRGSKTSSPSDAIANVTPEKTTVRPAVSAVRRIAARRPSATRDAGGAMLLAEPADDQQPVVDREPEADGRDDVHDRRVDVEQEREAEQRAERAGDRHSRADQRDARRDEARRTRRASRRGRSAGRRPRRASGRSPRSRRSTRRAACPRRPRPWHPDATPAARSAASRSSSVAASTTASSGSPPSTPSTVTLTRNPSPSSATSGASAGHDGTVGKGGDADRRVTTEVCGRSSRAATRSATVSTASGSSGAMPYARSVSEERSSSSPASTSSARELSPFALGRLALEPVEEGLAGHAADRRRDGAADEEDPRR